MKDQRILPPPGLRVAFTGGRDYPNHRRVRDVVLGVEPAFVLVGDCATGADRFVRRAARDAGLPLAVFIAAWERYGNGAGPIRNGVILRHGRPDFLIAFPGGNGTADCVRQAESLGIPVHHVNP